MLKQLRGILGNVTGKLGGYMFYMSKGQNLCRARRKENPLNVSDLQIIARNSMVYYSILFTRLYDSILYHTLRLYPSVLSIRIAWFKLNLKNHLSNGSVDWSKLIVSYGNLTNRDVTTYSVLSSPTRLRIRFSTAYDNVDSFGTDRIHGFIYNSVRDQIQLCTYVSYRSQGWLDCLIPSNWSLLDKSYFFYWYENQALTRLSTSRVRQFN